MKNNVNFIFFIALFVTSCMPKIEQAVEDGAKNFSDKSLDRKIASENAVNSFNALDVQMNTRIGDREFIQNVFVDIFGPTSDAIVKPFIIDNGMAYNGGCSQYEAIYPNTPMPAINANFTIDDIKANCGVSIFNLPIIGTENSIREGLRIQACEKVVSDTTSLFYLIDNVTGLTNVQASFAINPTDEHIKKVYQKFYPGREISQDALDSLKTLVQSTSITNSKDRFKMLALTICMSADWQIP